MLPKLCHLGNDLVIIIIIQYIYCVVHMTYIPYLHLGTFFFSRYPSVALARNPSAYMHMGAKVGPYQKAVLQASPTSRSMC